MMIEINEQELIEYIFQALIEEGFAPNEEHIRLILDLEQCFLFEKALNKEGLDVDDWDDEE